MSFWTVLFAAFLASLMSAVVRKGVDWLWNGARDAAAAYKRGKATK